MQREQAVALLRAWARREGEEVDVRVDEDAFGGGSVYLEGDAWTLSVSYDCYDVVRSRVGMWRRRPAGREASVAWIVGRVATYGPPACVAELVPSASRPAEVILEWPAAGGCLGVTLHGGDAWDVREDLDAYPRPRAGLVALGEHRRALAQLGERLACRRVREGWGRECRCD